MFKGYFEKTVFKLSILLHKLSAALPARGLPQSLMAGCSFRDPLALKPCKGLLYPFHLCWLKERNPVLHSPSRSFC